MKYSNITNRNIYFCAILHTKIATIERGTREPDLETLCKLIDLYKISADDILGTNKKNTSETL